MNAVEKTINFLSKILTSLGLTIHGRAIVIETEDSELAVTVGGKTLVLPTKETLKLSQWDKEVAFNPLCENTLRGESEVQQELLTMVRSAVNIRLAAMIWNLVKVANSEECKKNLLNPEQAVFLPCLPGLDATMVKNIGRAVQGIDPSEYKTSLIHMNLKRRTKINGKPFDRACLVRFPLAEMERTDKPYGAALRVKDLDALIGLMDYILPDWQVENAYSRGTDSKVAPYFVATLLAYQNINARLSEVAALFVDLFPVFGALIHEDDWVTDMDDLARMRDSMPSLEGNEGQTVRGASTEAPIISDPRPPAGIQRSNPVQNPNNLDLPFDTGTQPGQIPKEVQPTRAPVQDDDAVEYVPASQQPGQVPMHQPLYNQPQHQVPAGYGQPPQSQYGQQPLTFAQLQAQRQQQMYGGAYVAPNQPAPVGGSPFSNTAPVPVQQQPQYGVAYVAPQPNYNQNPGRGF